MAETATFKVTGPEWLDFSAINFTAFAKYEKRLPPIDTRFMAADAVFTVGASQLGGRPLPCFVCPAPFADLVIFHREHLSDEKARRLMDAKRYWESNHGA